MNALKDFMSRIDYNAKLWLFRKVTEVYRYGIRKDWIENTQDDIRKKIDRLYLLEDMICEIDPWTDTELKTWIAVSATIRTIEQYAKAHNYSLES